MEISTLQINATKLLNHLENRYTSNRPKRRIGHAIVNNSSIVGLIGLPGASPYVASKHAVMGLTRSAALDYAKQDIRINAVNPGSIATDAFDRTLMKMGITADDLTAMVPMGRIAQAEEVAQVVVFLCSDAASYITGQPFAIDGGYTAS